MADLVICEKQDLVDIADAIRGKNGSSSPMSISDMKDAIYNISSGGASIETCTLKFPRLGSTANELISSTSRTYFTVFLGSGIKCSSNLTQILCYDGVTLEVVKGAMIYNDSYDIGSTLACDNNIIAVDSRSGIYIVKGDATFTLSDNAPQN